MTRAFHRPHVSLLVICGLTACGGQFVVTTYEPSESGGDPEPVNGTGEPETNGDAAARAGDDSTLAGGDSVPADDDTMPAGDAVPSAGGDSPVRRHLLSYGGWETTSFAAQDDYVRSMSHPNDGWVEVSNERSRAGARSLRIFLDYDGPEGAEFRSEISDNNRGPSPVTLATTYWIGFSVFVPAGWAVESADWDNQVIWQYHTSPDAPANTSPGTAIRIQNGRWRATLKYDLQDGAGVQSAGGDLDRVAPGVWTDFVVQVRWDSSAAGFMRVWQDQSVGDAPAWSYAGPTSPVGDTGGYNKFGLYHTGWKFNVPGNIRRRTYFIDEIRIGDADATFGDVAP